MFEFLNMRREETDVIVIDSPPVLALTDAAILASLVDGVILVVDSGQTKRESAQRSKEALEKAGARILGIVLNRMPLSGDYYSNKYYASAAETIKVVEEFGSVRISSLEATTVGG